MSNLSLFMKSNKKTKDNTKYIATKSLCDENGNPLEWEIKPISTKENERIQEESTTEVQIPGKFNQYRHKVNTSLYATKLAVESVVFPDLLSAELQDSYGVKTPEDLIQELIDDSGEWNAFIMFINKFNNFTPIQESVATAKN